MMDLWPRWQRRTVALMLVALPLIALILFLGTMLTQRQRLGGQWDHLAGERAQVLAALGRRLAAGEGDRASRLLPETNPGLATATLLGHLEALTQQAGLTPVSRQSLAPRQAEGLVIVSVSMDVIGPYGALLGLIAALETEERALVIADTSLEASGAPDGPLRLRLVVEGALVGGLNEDGEALP
jgi:hypothetical protein